MQVPYAQYTLWNAYSLHFVIFCYGMILYS